MTEIQMIALRDLRPGAEIGMDCRHTRNTADIEALAASIYTKGLISPLAVYYQPERDKWFVIDGNRRLAALNVLAEHGRLPDDHVPCIARDEDDAELFETSLVANIERVALHPVDEYEAFWSLRERGMAEEEIGRRFNADPKLVRQRLALGGLHPEIRQAWREDKIDAAAARVFTLAQNPDDQLKAWREIEGMSHWTTHTVRRLLTGDTSGMGELAAVGEQAYLDRGGQIGEDLFGEDRFVIDRPLLDTMVRELLEADCAALVEDGWKWAKSDDAIDDRWMNWPRLRGVEPRYTKAAQKRLKALEGDYSSEAYLEREEIQSIGLQMGFSAEQKAATGVIVHLAHRGKITRHFGFYAPEDAPEETASDGSTPKTKEPAKAKVPSAVVENLCRTQTSALAVILFENPYAARALLVTTLMMPNHGSPLCIKASGSPTVSVDFGDIVKPTFEDTLRAVVALGPLELGLLEGRVIADAVDATLAARTGWNGKGVQDETARAAFAGLDGAYRGGNAMSTARLDAEKLSYPLHAAFDFEAHFAGQPKEAAIADMREAMGGAWTAEWEAKLRKSKKADIVAEAVKLVRPTGWLPAAIRVQGG